MNNMLAEKMHPPHDFLKVTFKTDHLFFSKPEVLGFQWRGSRVWIANKNQGKCEWPTGVGTRGTPLPFSRKEDKMIQ